MTGHSTIAIAKIEGKDVKYDSCITASFCDLETAIHTNKAFTYIGSGYIYSIDGVLQSGTTLCWFFKNR